LQTAPAFLYGIAGQAITYPYFVWLPLVAKTIATIKIPYSFIFCNKGNLVILEKSITFAEKI
jgi:hypothetical protein